MKDYRIIESDEDRTNRILPDTSLVMALRFRGQVNRLDAGEKTLLSPGIISGLRKSVRLYNYASNTGTLIVTFKEAGAFAFLNSPAHELFEESVSLENFITREKLSQLEEELFFADSTQKRIWITERFLLSEIRSFKNDPLIESALHQIHTSRGTIRVKELSNMLFISQDAFEKRFRKLVGTSPKQFSALVRLRSVITKPKSLQTLTETAYEAGYFDQSHFIKDFKLFTGQTPGEFYKLSSFW